MNTVAQIEQSKTAVAVGMTSGKREKSEKSSSDDKDLKSKSVKKRMGSRELKNHLKYIVPEIRLALIREPGVKALALRGAEDLDQFIEPLKHYSDYVPKLNMCRRWQQAHPVRGGALALRHINFKANPTISAALHPLSNEHQRDMFHLT